MGIASEESDGEVEIMSNNDTDQSSERNARGDDDNAASNADLDYHVSPNGVIWHANPPPPRRLNRNIIDFRSGPRVTPLRILKIVSSSMKSF